MLVVIVAIPQVINSHKLLDAANDRHLRPLLVRHTAPTPPPATPKTAPFAPAAPRTHATTAATGVAYGIAAGSSLPSLSQADLQRSIDDMKALGIGWVRFDMEWENVQPNAPSQYDWSVYDRVVQALRSNGLQSLAILDYTPAWARQSVCAQTPKCAPADPGSFAAFAAAAASRYGSSGVHAWEIWNEPNTATFFQPAANPATYTALLKAAYGAIKQVQPFSTVLTGGTAPAGNEDGNLTPPDFINGIYAAGAGGSFDAIADHPYTYPFTAAYPNPYNAWGQMATIHSIMAAHGDGAKKVWITEYGAPTGGPGGQASSGMTSAETGSDHVTEALQAASVARVVAIARTFPWAGPFFWYSYRDAGTTSDTNENFFGLVRADWSHKPAYAVFQQAIAGG